jgi:hypothetical protein
VIPGAVMIGACASPTPTAPHVNVWGSLREVIHAGRTESRVTLASVVGPHVYALGAVDGMRGEITVVDGTAWVSLGAVDDGRARAGAGDDGAALLVAATVERWRRVVITADIPFAALDREVARLAREAGADLRGPVPFVVEGALADARWHVLRGPPDATAPHDHAGNAVRGEAATMNATVVGFFSTRHEGVFTHMGQHVHAHVVDASGELSAHLDEVSIRAGATIAFPGR